MIKRAETYAARPGEVIRPDSCRRFNPAALKKIERQLERFHAELWRAQYLNWAGLSSALDFSGIYDRYDPLFSPEAVRGLSGCAGDPKRIKFVQSFIAANYLEGVFRKTNEDLARAETEATVEYKGGTIPYRAIAPLIANENDADARHALSALNAEKNEELNPLRVSVYSGLDEHARKFGFTNYVQMCNEIFRLGLPGLSPKIKRILRQTEAIYRDALDRYLGRLGLPSDQGYACDLSAIFRVREHDVYFQKDKLGEIIQATLRDLGIDLNGQANVSLDLGSRPLKHPRSFCAPIRIPQEVVLVLAPRGGWLDYRAGLHELGHAEHFAGADIKLPFAYKFCGDLSVTEAYAFLFDNIICEKYWIEKHLGIPNPSEYLRINYFFRLFSLRRMMAKVLYEQELYASPDISKMGQRYAEISTASLGVRFDGRNYLVDTDKGFYGLLYLRGMVLEVQLRKYLKINYGERWFANPKAGAFLRQLWSYGIKYDAEEISRKLGYAGIDYDLLSQDVLDLTKALNP